MTPLPDATSIVRSAKGFETGSLVNKAFLCWSDPALQFCDIELNTSVNVSVRTQLANPETYSEYDWLVDDVTVTAAVNFGAACRVLSL